MKNKKYKLISVDEDDWNFGIEIEIDKQFKFTARNIDELFLDISKMIYKSKSSDAELHLKYFLNYIDDNYTLASNLIIETDILKLSNEKLIAEMYLYQKKPEKFIAKSFFVFDKKRDNIQQIIKL